LGRTDSTFGALYRSDEWLVFIYDLPCWRSQGRYLITAPAVRTCSRSHPKCQRDEHQEFAEQTSLLRWDYQLHLGDGSRWYLDRRWGLSLTTRDMAKLGYLYLHAGEWNGVQVVSSAWIDRATHKLVEGDGELGYGYLWWIYPRFGAYAAWEKKGRPSSSSLRRT